MHRFTRQAGKEGDSIAVFFYANTPGHDLGQRATEAVSHVGDERPSFRTLCQMGHVRSMLGNHRFLGIIVESLANDQERFPVIVAVRVGNMTSAASETLPEIFFQR
jgi:hypothetical protein